MFKNKTFVFGAIATVIVMGVVALFVGGAAPTPHAAAAASTPDTAPVSMVESVDASGVLAAQSAARLTWTINGTVDKVNVKVGDQVKAGDILMALQTRSVAANIIAAQADLINAKQSLDNTLKSNLPEARAQKELADAQKALDDAQQQVDRLNRPRVSADLIAQTADDIEAAQNGLKFMTKIYDKYLHYNTMDKDRLAKAKLSLKLTTMQENLANLTAKYNWYISAPSAVSVAQAQAALNSAKARMENAQREYDRLKGGPNAESIASARARVEAVQATVNQLYIIAPFDGEVLAIEQIPGDTVSAGATALLIADRSQLYIDAQVAEAEIALVKVGQTALVSLDSIPGTTFTGRVTEVDTVGKTASGLIKYTVRVDLNRVNNPSPLLGGSADVTIQIIP